MFLVQLPGDHSKLFLDESRAIFFTQEHNGTLFCLTLEGKIGDQTAVAWRVQSTRRGVALFLERSRAIQYSADNHGTIQPLFKQL